MTRCSIRDCARKPQRDAALCRAHWDALVDRVMRAHRPGLGTYCQPTETPLALPA